MKPNLFIISKLLNRHIEWGDRHYIEHAFKIMIVRNSMDIRGHSKIGASFVIVEPNDTDIRSITNELLKYDCKQIPWSQAVISGIEAQFQDRLLAVIGTVHNPQLADMEVYRAVGETIIATDNPGIVHFFMLGIPVAVADVTKDKLYLESRL